MSHILKSGTSIFKNGDNIFKVNDKLNVLVENKGGWGASMEGLRCDPVATNTRVAVSSGSSVKIVNTETFALIATINLPTRVVGFAWDSPNNKLYVTAGGLYIINTTTWAYTNSGLTANYNGVALDPIAANNRLALTTGAQLHFVNTATFTTTHAITSGFSGAYGLIFDPQAPNRVYVGNYASNYVSVIDTDNFVILSTISGFNSPIDVAFDPNLSNNRFVVSEYASGQFAYVNRGTHGIQKRIPTIANCDGVSFHPNIAKNQIFTAAAALGQYFIVNEILT